MTANEAPETLPSEPLIFGEKMKLSNQPTLSGLLSGAAMLTIALAANAAPPTKTAPSKAPATTLSAPKSAAPTSSKMAVKPAKALKHKRHAKATKLATKAPIKG